MRPLSQDLRVRFCRALDRAEEGPDFVRAFGDAARGAGRGGVLRHTLAVPGPLRQNI